MKNIRYSTKARKDLKRYVGFPDKMRKLFQVLRLLQLGFPIPPEFKPHFLSGKLSGLLECHVENDFLLIWKEDSDIYVVRIGTHSELFKK